ncbi:creatininase family protein [Desulforhopalus singaporensis]|uniref:Creatinine amidohydrolase n=1 Tax=Desulforhopalus singaporensis TaxID=91360 RepID=A0A1H0P1Q3_9BACT|nr:creatininase family protein [Desulforhopalus singaporensis]SDO98590.1 creatinine amidohydrolase [Desulforhopalus singaporensis]
MKTKNTANYDSSPNIHRLLNLSWIEINELDKSRTVVLLPVSPIEEHGPHLPVGTDVFGAEDIAGKTVSYLSQSSPDTHAVLAPVIPLGCAPITADFPGTFPISGNTFKNLISEFCESLTKSGFRYIVIVNHHLDSVHLKAILEAIEKVEQENDVRIVETAGRLLYSDMQLSELEECRNLGLDIRTEMHGDVRETSYILHKDTDLLKLDYHTLKPVLIDIKQGMKEGKKTFREMGATDGYVGSPALANDDLGRIHLEEQGMLIAEMITALLKGESLPEMRPAISAYLKNRVTLN